MVSEESSGQMWAEKYRSTDFNQVINQETVTTTLKEFLKTPQSMPHLLFSGPPGTGKTTLALIVANKVLQGNLQQNLIEMNASDERRLEDVREKIKTFARHIGFGVPFKIVILDEADHMARDTQPALRRIMEEFSESTRFILTCNFSSNIIEPIQSRCVVLQFRRLPAEEVMKHLEEICKKEGVKAEKEALQIIIEVTEGDLRHSLNLLQAAASRGPITVENVNKIEGISYRTRVGEIVDTALSGNFREARQQMMELRWVYGLSESDFMRYANSEIFRHPIEDPDKIARILAKYDSRLSLGANPDIQLTALLSELSIIGSRPREPADTSRKAKASAPKQKRLAEAEGSANK